MWVAGSLSQGGLPGQALCGLRFFFGGPIVLEFRPRLPLLVIAQDARGGFTASVRAIYGDRWRISGGNERLVLVRTCNDGNELLHPARRGILLTSVVSGSNCYLFRRCKWLVINGQRAPQDDESAASVFRLDRWVIRSLCLLRCIAGGFKE